MPTCIGPASRIARARAGCVDDREPAQNGSADGREDDVEAVALGLDLRAIVRGNRLANRPAIAFEERSGVCGAMTFEVSGVVAKVGE